MFVNLEAAKMRDTLWMQSWPEEDLETLDACPVCGARERVILHEDLKDSVFFCAPGRWMMWRCLACDSGYLNPRPTVATNGRAYTSYYTHQASESENARPTPIITRLVNLVRKRGRPAYWNTVYGHSLKPDLGPANALTKLLPAPLKSQWDNYIRHLPAAQPGQSFLDIGCGSGNFLRIASKLGYTVTGLEIDPVAVNAARTFGCKVVNGSLPASGLQSEQFDHVTISHVLEHVHDLRSSICEIQRLLKPNGRIWLQVPNIKARGHESYGPAWFGLDPPRHLLLPSLKALEETLQSSGFSKIKLLRSADIIMELAAESEVIHRLLNNVLDGYNAPHISRRALKALMKEERRYPAIHEYLTLIAYKL